LQSSIKSLSYRNGMNTLIDTPKSAKHSHGIITILMESGQELTFPCEAYPRLADASDEQLSNIELSPMGLHWPDLDEDLSIRGLIRYHAKR
jgi:hypothetical protein